MQNPYQTAHYAQRHQSPQQQIDSSRQPYTPFPPPPHTATPGGGTLQQGILLPPPPPRRYPSQAPASTFPPPPPPSAPRQSPWPRQQTYYSSSLPPPPVKYDPGAYYNYQHQDNQPLTSANYIPTGESFGPGVGIPPLNPGGGQAFNSDWQYNDYYTNFQRSSELNSERSPVGGVALDNTTGASTEPTSGGQTNGALARPEGSTPTSAISDYQAAEWPLNRVLNWLDLNSFSAEWQETFQTLNVHGSQFLEIGQAKGGKGSLSIMHGLVYPQLAKQCTKSGASWDPVREESRRLRRLIRGIKRGTKQPPHQQLVDDGGDSMQDGLAVPPSLPDESSLSPSTAGEGDASPDLHGRRGTVSPFSPNSKAYAEHRASQSTQDLSIAKTTLDDSGSRSPGDEHNRAVQSAGGLRDVGHNSQEGLLAEASNASERDLGGGYVTDPAITQVHTTSGDTQHGIPSISQQRYYGHHRGRSSDSMTARSASQARSTWTDNETRSGTHDSRRPSAGETASKLEVNNTKEHRSIFKNLFARGSKRDDGHHSPDEPLARSPSSPVSFRLPSISSAGRPSNNGDSAVETFLSKRTAEDLTLTPASASTVRALSTSRYVLVTPDGWNYRLVNVTGIQGLKHFMETIGRDLSLPNDEQLSIFLTSPGQEHHGEPLTDFTLEEVLQRADDSASLKFYIQTPYPVSLGTGVGSVFPTADKLERPQLKQGYHAFKAQERASSEELYHNTSSSTTQSINDQTPSDRPREAESFAKGGTERLSLQFGIERGPTPEPYGEDGQQEGERSQRSLNKRDRSMKDPPVESSSQHLLRSSRVINFDVPRTSPFADSFPEYLVPHRKAPPVPPDTSTLIKANSLSRRASVVPRQSWHEAYESSPKRQHTDEHPNEAATRERRRAAADNPLGSSGISGALAGVGRMSGSIGAPQSNSNAGAFKDAGSRTGFRENGRDPPRALASINFNPPRISPGSPRSPGITMSKGNVQFKIPEYEDERGLDQPAKRSPAPSAVLHRIVTELKKVPPTDLHPSPDVSPSTQQPPKKVVTRASTRKGPQLDFKETPVSFERNLAEEASQSDEDSDDGLFAVPLEKPKELQKSPEQSAAPLTRDRIDSDETVESSSSAKPRQFAKDKDPRGPLNGGAYDAANPLMKSTDSPDDDEKTLRYNIPIPRAPKRSTALERKVKGNNRQSFISDDWAPRPAPEALVEHLDDFFPNVDLDQPSLYEEESEGRKKDGADNESSNGDPSDVSRDGETPKVRSPIRSPAVNELAQRQIRRAGALGRTKSIREVVRGAYQHPNDRFSVLNLPRIGTLKGGDIGRRQSTKMFGAKIEQIKPPRGSRIFPPLDTIPQATMPQDKIDILPHRDRTFKWVKGQLIGKGSFGRVYLGMNTTTGELLAVKQVEVNPKTAGQDKDKIKEMVKAMDGEIDTMQHLDHVNIVQYLGCERKEYSISIFLEYISGGSIGSCLRKHGKFEESVVASLTRQILCGLAYLHDEGILHRDLKADNILLDIDGTCKISDFGISKKTDNIYGNDATNGMQGSVFWMAPEVVGSSVSGYSAKVDIWSLGCVVLEMFTGKRPWAKEEVIGAIYKLGSLNQAPPIPDSESIGLAGLSFMYDCFQIDERDRPTAGVLMRSPFCNVDPNYNFIDTELYAKIKPAHSQGKS